jgi:hypothetical protein
VKIIVRENTDYDTDVHPEVTKIRFKKNILQEAFSKIITFLMLLNMIAPIID